MGDGETNQHLKKGRDEHKNQRKLDARLNDQIARDALKIAETDKFLRWKSRIIFLCAEVGRLDERIDRCKQAQHNHGRE